MRQNMERKTTPVTAVKKIARRTQKESVFEAVGGLEGRERGCLGTRRRELELERGRELERERAITMGVVGKNEKGADSRPERREKEGWDFQDGGEVSECCCILSPLFSLLSGILLLGLIDPSLDP